MFHSKLAMKYLEEGYVMQLATVSNCKPWICTVYYVADDAGNLYWLSLPSRRHSQEIASGSAVAVAVAVKLDQPVVGLQAEGRAELVTDLETIKQVMKKYVAKYNTGHSYYKNYMAGTDKHKMYKFTPKQYTLFDELNK